MSKTYGTTFPEATIRTSFKVTEATKQKLSQSKRDTDPLAAFKEKVVVSPTKKCVFDPFEKAAQDLGSENAKLQEMNESLWKENTELFRLKEFAQHLEKKEC